MEETCCDSSKECKSPKKRCRNFLPIMLKIGAASIFFFYIGTGIYSVFSSHMSIERVVSVMGFQFIAGIFQPLVLLGLARLVESNSSQDYPTQES